MPLFGSKAASILLLFILALSLLPATAHASNSIIRKLHFPNPEFLKMGDFDLVKIDGTAFQAKPGHPYLPVKVVKFVLGPTDRVLGVEVRAEYEKVKGRFNVPPSPAPKTLDNLSGLEFTQPDPAIYSMDRPFPESPYTYRVFHGLDPDTLKPATYVAVYLYPVRYTPATGELYFASDMEVTLSYERDDSQALQGDIDLLIITPQEFLDQAQRLQQARNAQGIATAIETLADIYASYPGIDYQERIRNCIKDYRQSHGIEFVLLLGDADKIPARLAYIPDGYDDSDDPSYEGDGSFVETDLYYADLDGTWNSDGDEFWGELDDGIDGLPDVFVGRLPASSYDEAQLLVDKVLGYQPENEWFMTYLMLGTDTFGNREGEYLKDYILSNFVWANFTAKRLYESWGTLTVGNVINEIDEGYGFINFAGHGNPDGWWFGDAGGFYTSNDAYNQVNENASVIFTMACSTSRFYDTDSIAEEFLLNPNGGGIAYFGSTRVAWGYGGTSIVDGLAGEMDWRFNEALFYYLSSTPYLGNIWGRAEAGYILNHGIEDTYDWKTIAEYGTVMGDPSLIVKGGGEAPPPEPFQVYGKVSDARSGDPVSGALVSLYTEDGTELINSTYTDELGNYRIEGTGYESGLLKVEKDEYYSRELPVDLGQNTQVDFDLVPFIEDDFLLVVDDDGSNYVGDGVWPSEITSVLDSMGISYFVWYESRYDRPPLQALQDARLGVIWHAGTYSGMAVDDQDAETLLQFVNDGGNLILEGEDIGYDHRNDEFLQDVAHAKYEADNSGIYTLNVTDPEHPVAWSLPSQFSFESPPPYPDSVSPVDGGHEVIAYDGDSSALITFEGSGKTVYIAFPLHYLGYEERSQLIENSVRWLAGLATPNLEVWPAKVVEGVLNPVFLCGEGFPDNSTLWFFTEGWDEAVGGVGLGAPGDEGLKAKTTPAGTIPSHAFVLLNGTSSFFGVATSASRPGLSERAYLHIERTADISSLPYFTVRPATLSYGERFRVAGENFTPNGTVEIYWNSPDLLVSTVQADASGRVDIEIVVPESPSGRAALMAYDVSKGLLALNRFDGSELWLPMEVEPTVNGTSIAGLAGEVVRLEVHGLSHVGSGASYVAYPQAHIDLNSTTLGGMGLAHPAFNVSVSAEINATLLQDIPDTGFKEVVVPWSAGEYSGTARGFIPVSRPAEPAAGSFNVEGETVLEGKVGDRFRVYGWNFGWVELVEVDFGNRTLGLLSPDSNGFVRGTFIVPELPAGTYEVDLVQSSERATLYYTVLPSLRVNVSQAEAGEWITLYGYGLNVSRAYIPREAGIEILTNAEFNLVKGTQINSTAVSPDENGTIILEYRAFYNPSLYWSGEPIKVSLSGLSTSYKAVGHPEVEERALPLLLLHDIGLEGLRSVAVGRNVWVSTDEGLVKIPRRGTPETYDINAVLLLEFRRALWFSTPDSKVGRLRSDGLTYWDLPANVIDMAVDRRGNLWFTYHNGYGKIDSRTGSLQVYDLDSEPKGIAVDRRGNVWLALPSEGVLLKRDARSGEEHEFPVLHAPEWIAAGRSIWFVSGQLLCRFDEGEESYWDLGAELARLSVDRRENVWITAEGSLFKFHAGSWNRYDIEGIRWASPGARDVWLIVNDTLSSFSTRRGVLHIYTIPSTNATQVIKADGLYILDREHGLLISDRAYEVPYPVYEMALDRYGNLWLASYGGLLKFDGSEFLRVTEFPVYSVKVDRHGALWFSGRDYVFSLDVRRGTMKAYSSGIKAEYISVSRRGLWLIEGERAYFLDTRSNRTTSSADLPAKPLAVATDRRGDLWLATPSGLVKVSYPSSVEEINVGEVYSVGYGRNLVYGMDGVVAVEGRRGTSFYYTPGTICSIFVDRRGTILAGTADGLIYLLDFRAMLG